jgi:hypothetical protein
LKNFTQRMIINMDIEDRCAPYLPSKELSRDKVDRIIWLMNKVGILLYDKEKIGKYLKKNINPSIYIVKKLIDNFIPKKEYLYERFKPNDKNRVNMVFEKLFHNMMLLYTEKKNYYELPFYLNYLVIKSNPFMQKFFYLTVKNKEMSNFTAEEGMRITHYDIVKYLCKHFDHLFEKYTNYGHNILTKLQMIQLYNLQPPQAKIISPYLPILESPQVDLVKIKDNKLYESGPKDMTDKYRNPFMSKLGNACDIHPDKYEIEFVESKIL